MDDKEVEHIADRVVAKIQGSRTISPETHEAHHLYLKSWFERQAKRDIMWEGVKKQVLGWGIITILSYVGVKTYHVFF